MTIKDKKLHYCQRNIFVVSSVERTRFIKIVLLRFFRIASLETSMLSFQSS